MMPCVHDEGEAARGRAHLVFDGLFESGRGEMAHRDVAPGQVGVRLAKAPDRVLRNCQEAARALEGHAPEPASPIPCPGSATVEVSSCSASTRTGASARATCRDIAETPSIPASPGVTTIDGSPCTAARYHSARSAATAS